MYIITENVVSEMVKSGAEIPDEWIWKRQRVTKEMDDIN